MKKLILIMVGLAWFVWPEKSRALSLGCELPGYEVEQHKPPEGRYEWCIQMGCKPNMDFKIPMPIEICSTGIGWQLMRLYDCEIVNGQCWGKYAPAGQQCEVWGYDFWFGDGIGWWDWWGDRWGWK